MPVAIPSTLVCTLADDTGNLDFACQRVVCTCANTLAIDHGLFEFDVVNIEGLTLTGCRLFIRPDSQYVVTSVGNLFEVRTSGELIDHHLPAITTVVPCNALSIVGSVLALQLYQYVVGIRHLQSHGQTAQCLEVNIANGQCCIVVLIAPAARVSLQGELHHLVVTFFHYGRFGTIPKATVTTCFLAFAVPQYYLCVTNCCCEEHSE